MKPVVIAVILSTLFTACSPGKKDENDLIHELNQNLKGTTGIISLYMDSQFKELEYKSTLNCHKEIAMACLKMAKIIREETGSILQYIYDLEQQDTDNPSYGMLFKNLSDYRNKILLADTTLNTWFPHAFDFLKVSMFRITGDSSGKKNDKTGKELNMEEKKVNFSLLVNQIHVLQSKILTYYKVQLGCITESFEAYSMLVGQSSNYLEPGSALEITAGLGIFSTAKVPVIKFNKIPVPVNYNGVAVYKFNVPVKPGKYHVHAEINYTNAAGYEETRTIPVEYTVIAPCPTDTTWNE